MFACICAIIPVCIHISALSHTYPSSVSLCSYKLQLWYMQTSVFSESMRGNSMIINLKPHPGPAFPTQERASMENRHVQRKLRFITCQHGKETCHMSLVPHTRQKWLSGCTVAVKHQPYSLLFASQPLLEARNTERERLWSALGAWFSSPLKPCILLL